MSKPKKREKSASIKNARFSNNLLLIIYIPILLVIFFKVYGDVFDEKIYLGGDNASYYILGNSIATGQGYTNIHIKEKTSHNHFPPGYPLIIATASKLFSNNILFIKKVNGFFLLLSVGLLFLVVYKFTGNYHVSFIVGVFTLYNIHLLGFSIIMMSEIPFLFFSLLSLWLFMKLDFSIPVQKNWLFFILLLSVSFTYHIRSLGIALFFGIATYMLFEKKWKYLASYSFGFILLALPWYLRGKALGGNAYVSQLFLKNPYRPELGQMELFDWFIRIWNNFERYITREIPSGTFNFIQVVDSKTPFAALEWIIGIACVLLMLFGLFKIKKFNTVLTFYIVGTFGILLLWPDVWFGVRFLLPLVPLLTFLFLYGVIEMLHWFGEHVLKIKNQSVIYFSIVFLSLLAIRSYSNTIEKLEKQKSGIYSKNYQNYFELAKWIKANTSDTSVTCCRKPQLFHLYSTKYVTGIKTTIDTEEQIAYLISREVDYVVLEKLGYSSTGRNLYPAVEKYPHKFILAKQLRDPDTPLLQFVPELDYWGEWKDNKRNGRGKYGWDDGTKFDGLWKDNRRNGKGTLYLADGSQLDGVWTNDTLNGVVYVKSIDGDTIERSLYEKNMKIGMILVKK